VAAAGNKAGTKPDESDELLAGLTGGKDVASDDDFADVDDLLDQVEEDDSEGWVPTERGEGISGTVVKISETRSDFANDGEDPMCPTVTIQTKDGTKFRVIGYGAVLKREIQDADPHVGDLMAVKYFGEKPIKKGRFAGKPYKHFGVVVRRKSA
jgi:hypothetical protein